MSDPKLPMRGENVAVTVLINNRPHDQSDNCRKINIEPKHKVFEDKLLARKRDRLDQQLRGWKASADFEHTDNVMFKAWAEVQRARENNEPIPPIAVAITYEMRDGASETWALQRCVLTPKKDVAGSDEAATMSWEIHAEDYVQTL